MKSKYLANYCMDNPEHPMFKLTDGARCVQCEGMVNVKEVNEIIYRALPTYKHLLDKRKSKLKPKQSLSISVNMNTDKLQLKLRAIAKHTEALADELDVIDSMHDDELPTRLEGSE